MPGPLPSSVAVAVVGAGFSGIGMAARCRRAGIDDVVVLDRGEAVGGTWRDNHYPGAACDIPSHLYSYSFAPNPDWSRAYSPQEEIRRYLEDCVTRFGVGDRIHLGHDVVDAAYDEAAGRWHLRTSAGAALSARAVVWATGPLSEPRVPNLPGLAEFRGATFHSAAWDHGVDLRGARVAVVGTGASAAQFVPRIQPGVGRLSVYQRTPPWVVPRRDRALGPWRRRAYRHLPPLRLADRAATYLRLELVVGPAVLGRSPRRRALLERLASDHLERQVPDPELRALLQPDYAIGCKRVLVSDDYYPALAQPNVELVPAAVRALTADAVVDERGGVRPVDVVVFGTGFQAAEPSFARRIRGRGGERLSEAWRDGMSAYLGSTVPGFPNLFLMVGPNTTLGHNSMVYMIESQLAYVGGALALLSRPGVGSVEVRRPVFERYRRWLDSAMEGTAWTAGGCTSWYLDRHGRNTTLWPGRTDEFRRLTRRFHPADYAVRPPAG